MSGVTMISLEIEVLIYPGKGSIDEPIVPMDMLMGQR